MIISFRNNFSFLSNFYKSPIQGYNEFLGMHGTFPSVENAYQAAKCSERKEFQTFLSCTPVEAKKLGRKVKMNPSFDAQKIEIMNTLVENKFSDTGLAEKLIKTAPYSLVEGNTWHDNFWGMCMCDTCMKHKRIHARNMLGEILMNVRDNLVSGDIQYHNYDYPFTVFENQVFHKNRMEFIEKPSVCYDRETYTVIKVGDYDTCRETILNAGTSLPLDIYSLEKMTPYGACEVLNCCLAFTGYMKRITEGAEQNG